jgi:ribosomal protein L37AE/L43A
MLMQIGEHTPCPFCKTKIPLSGIKIVSEEGTHCFIRFSCEKCKEEFSGHAQMQQLKTRVGKALNASSLIERNHDSPEKVSSPEVQGMQHFLQQNVSFTEFFQQKK